jgi:hypothetical protein
MHPGALASDRDSGDLGRRHAGYISLFGAAEKKVER